MNSEVDLTKQCYQIWHKVAKVAKKCYQKWQKVAKVEKKGSIGFCGEVAKVAKKVLPETAKSGQSGQKVPKWRKRVPWVSKEMLRVRPTQARAVGCRSGSKGPTLKAPSSVPEGP